MRYLPDILVNFQFCGALSNPFYGFLLVDLVLNEKGNKYDLRSCQSAVCMVS